MTKKLFIFGVIVSTFFSVSQVFAQIISVDKNSYYTSIDSVEKKVDSSASQTGDDTKQPTIQKNDSGLFYFQNAEGQPLNDKLYDDVSGFENGFAKIKRNNGWGFIDASGNEIVGIKYDYVWNYTKDEIAMVQKNIKYGLINTKGTEIAPIVYDYLDFYRKGWARYTKNGASGFLDKNGQEYTDVVGLQGDWFKVRRNNKWGLVNPQGVITIQPIYDDVRSFEEGFAYVNKGGKWLYVNPAGVEQPYDEIYLPFDTATGLVKVRTAEKFYHINKYGNEYDSARSLKNGRSISYKNNLQGLLHKTGAEIIKPSYISISEYRNGLAAVFVKNQYGFIDIEGAVKIQPQFDSVFSFSDNGIARVKKNKKYGFINLKGNIVIEIEYIVAKDFSENLAQVLINDKWGYIDVNNKIIIRPLYTSSNSYFEGFAYVQTKEGKWIYINKIGKEMTFDEIYPIKDSMAIVRKLNKFGFINANGDIVINGIYDAVQDFDNGLALVTKGNTKKLINKKGVELPYDNVYPFRDNLARVEKAGKVGFINKNGVEVIPSIYSNATDFNNGVSVANLNNAEVYVFSTGVTYDWISGYKNNMAIVKKQLKYGLINVEGFQILPPSYDAILFSQDSKYAFAQINGNYLLVNEIGLVKGYDRVFLFSENLAVVVKGGKYGYININGSEVITFDFDWADSFRGGKALVRKDGKYFYINNQGQLVK